MQRLEKIVVQEKAAKVPERPRYGNFRKVTQNPRFLIKSKRKTKENFLKMGQKIALAEKAYKHSGANGIFWTSAKGGPRETFQKSPKK